MTARAKALLAYEIVLAAIVFGFFVAVIGFVQNYGYLPQPFLHDPDDTLMDWFNTAFWAHSPVYYDVFLSVYPPLTPMLLKFLSIDSCYTNTPAIARDCDWVSTYAILISYASCCIVTLASFWKRDRRTAIPRSVAVAFGLPLLFTLERGNVLLIAFTTFLLGQGPLLKSSRLKWFADALSINFKPYLIVILATDLVRRRWLALEISVIFTVAVYAATWGVFGSGDPITVIDNIFGFAANGQTMSWQDGYYASSYNAIITLFSTLPNILGFIDGRAVDSTLVVLPIMIHLGQALIVAALLCAFVKRGLISRYRCSALSVAMIVITSQPAGGYSQMFLILMVFLEPCDGWAQIVAVGLCYALSIVGDLHISDMVVIRNDAWITGGKVTAVYGLALGQFIRPMGILLIVYALSIDTIRAFFLKYGFRALTEAFAGHGPSDRTADRTHLRE